MIFTSQSAKMIKPDLIIIWPYAYDYPVCRALVSQNRDKFGQVVVSFTHNDVSRDYRKWLRKNYPDWTFVDDGGSPNWYDGAVNTALYQVRSEYVMFLEQDFLFNRKFLKRFLRLAGLRDFVCYSEGERLHLACFISKLATINRTLRFFQPIGRYGLDCFDLFFSEMIAKNGDWSTTIGWGGHKHLNGLTQNLRLGITKKFDLIYHPEEFKHYLNLSLKIDVKQNSQWVKITQNILKKL